MSQYLNQMWYLSEKKKTRTININLFHPPVLEKLMSYTIYRFIQIVTEGLLYARLCAEFEETYVLVQLDKVMVWERWRFLWLLLF